MTFKVLIVDDEEKTLQAITRAMRNTSWEILTADNGKTALKMLEGVDVLITDVRMPEMSGIELMHEARTAYPQLEVIIMTAYATVSEAVSAIREGVRGYLEKPFPMEELLNHCQNIAREKELKISASVSGRGKLVGTSMQMRRIFSEIDVAAASSAPLLITGETGTGKDLTAHAVHEISGRSKFPFVPVNIGAISRELIESELFGHEKGAFTGAHSRTKGRFVLANKGSLFLDEITTLPLDLQPKLLRAIEANKVWPVGSDKPIECDVRIITATNADIETLVKNGEFREDLYYRLNVLRINIPPLSERPEDIPLIVRVLLDRMSEGAEFVPEISGDALAELISRKWPGNIRELGNVLERALAHALGNCNTGRVQIDMPSVAEFALPESEGLTFQQARNRAADRWAIQAIKTALASEKGNVTRAAKLLKMNRTALIRTMNKLNISKTNF